MTREYKLISMDRVKNTATIEIPESEFRTLKANDVIGIIVSIELLPMPVIYLGGRFLGKNKASITFRGM